MAPANRPVSGPIPINRLIQYNQYTVYTPLLNHAFTTYFLGFNPENEPVVWQDMLAAIHPDISIFYTPGDPAIPPTDEPIYVYDPPPFLGVNRFIPENTVNDIEMQNAKPSSQGGNRSMCRKNRRSRKNRSYRLVV